MYCGELYMALLFWGSNNGSIFWEEVEKVVRADKDSSTESIVSNKHEYIIGSEWMYEILCIQM